MTTSSIYENTHVETEYFREPVASRRQGLLEPGTIISAFKVAASYRIWVPHFQFLLPHVRNAESKRASCECTDCAKRCRRFKRRVDKELRHVSLPLLPRYRVIPDLSLAVVLTLIVTRPPTVQLFGPIFNMRAEANAATRIWVQSANLFLIVSPPDPWPTRVAAAIVSPLAPTLSESLYLVSKYPVLELHFTEFCNHSGTWWQIRAVLKSGNASQKRSLGCDNSFISELHLCSSFNEFSLSRSVAHRGCGGKSSSFSTV